MGLGNSLPLFSKFTDIYGTIYGAMYGRIYGTIYGTIKLTIHHYGFHNSGAGAEGACPTVVEAAEGRLHNGGW